MPPAAPDFFADALRREIIRSEQQRMRALAIILAVLLALSLTVANVLRLTASTNSPSVRAGPGRTMCRGQGALARAGTRV